MLKQEHLHIMPAISKTILTQKKELPMAALFRLSMQQRLIHHYDFLL